MFNSLKFEIIIRYLDEDYFRFHFFRTLKSSYRFDISIYIDA